jgi:energy-coupling factor transport system permease protein
MIGGSLDRAMDVAATLEVRGFASARRAPRVSRPWSRHDIAFLVSAAAVLAPGAGGARRGGERSTPIPNFTRRQRRARSC